MMNTLFIYNPNSGQKLIKYSLWDILNNFAKANYNLTVYPTRKSKECLNYIKDNGSKFDLIVVSGGDGTLNEAINGLMTIKKKRPLLGYIPAGTTNDFAATHKISKDMIKASEQVVAKKEVVKIDVGKFNDTYFDYVAAFGAFTDVSYNTPQDIKNHLGHLAYLIAGIQAISDITKYKLHIKTKELDIEDDFIFGMITNTYQVGGLYKFNSNEVKLDDGQFEVTLVRYANDAIELAEMAASLLDERINNNLVLRFKCDEITIESKKNVSWTLDGENGGKSKNVNIKVINKPISIIR